MIKTIYYTCAFVPEELIAACGCRPCRLVCAMENGAVSQTEGMCTFTEAWLESLLNKSADGETFAAIFTTSCDQMRRAYEIFCTRSGQPAFLLNVPTTETPACLDYYQQELERLERFLCSMGGHCFDINLINQASVSSPVTATEKHTLNIALTGGPVCEPVRSKLQNILSESQAAIVVDACEDRLRPDWKPALQTSSPADIRRQLAQAYFNLPAIWKRPNTALYQNLSTQIAAHTIDGIILFRHLFCDLWHSAAYELKQSQSIPILEIDLDGKADLSESAVSRVQAFLEVLA